MIKLIIFDFDDTLIDNSKLDYESFRNGCLENNAYLPTKKELFELRKKKFTAKKIIDYINKKTVTKINKDLFFKKRNNFLLDDDSVNYLVLKPYTKRIIKKLFSQNYSLLILTIRKRKSIIETFLEKNNLLTYFENIFNPEDSKLELRKSINAIKTKKKFFKKIISLHNVKTNEILYVGDSEVDLIAANESKVHFCLIENPFIKYHRKFHHKINSLKDLEFILKQLSNDVK